MLSNKPAVEEAIFDMTPRIAKEVLIVALNKWGISMMSMSVYPLLN